MIPAADIIATIALQHDRGNGLGGDFVRLGVRSWLEALRSGDSHL